MDKLCITLYEAKRNAGVFYRAEMFTENIIFLSI